MARRAGQQNSSADLKVCRERVRNRLALLGRQPPRLFCTGRLFSEVKCNALIEDGTIDGIKEVVCADDDLYQQPIQTP